MRKASSILRPNWQTLADSRQVYVGAPGAAKVPATDHDGQVVKKAEGLDGARDMAESADESTLSAPPTNPVGTPVTVTGNLT